jgi:thiosulfate reductase cytochrome b subunit
MSERKPLYALHERIWHWLQAATLVMLLVTGFAIHYPDRFGVLGNMARAVAWHSWVGLFMIANAFLGLFYHVTAEKYHHYLPALDDFTSGAIRQLRYYVFGIFKGEAHPLETDPRRKLNPLQKITYLALLNVLVPYQLASGALLWGADRWPKALATVGGLRVLGPAHTLGAYLFLAFLIFHVYLTTTGSTPTSLLRAMITGHELADDAPAEPPETVQEPASAGTDAESSPAPAEAGATEAE